MNPVAVTSLLVAAMRAEESQRPDRLFDDPFAATLAGDAGRDALRTFRAAAGAFIPIIEVRTRVFDEALARVAGRGVRQVVLLAAGMDARAYRLAWPDGVKLFEVDQGDVLAHKSRALADARPRCERTAVAADLATDWATPLVAHGFDASAPTAWLVEGILQYLDAASVTALFARIDALSAAGSVVFYDAVGAALLASPMLRPTLEMMATLGAPWRFGTDAPEALIDARRWDTVVTDPGQPGTQWGRWPFPTAPLEARNVPRGYIVEATRRV